MSHWGAPDLIVDLYSAAVPWLGALRTRVRVGIALLLFVAAVALSVWQAHVATELTLGCAVYAVSLGQLPAFALQLLASAMASMVMSREGWSRWLQMPLSLLAGVVAYLAGVFVAGALYTIVGRIVPPRTC